MDVNKILHSKVIDLSTVGARKKKFNDFIFAIVQLIVIVDRIGLNSLCCP